MKNIINEIRRLYYWQLKRKYHAHDIFYHRIYMDFENHLYCNLDIDIKDDLEPVMHKFMLV